VRVACTSLLHFDADLPGRGADRPVAGGEVPDGFDATVAGLACGQARDRTLAWGLLLAVPSVLLLALGLLGGALRWPVAAPEARLQGPR
jgi:hypothetical protein